MNTHVEKTGVVHIFFLNCCFKIYTKYAVYPKSAPGMEVYLPIISKVYSGYECIPISEV